MAVNVKNKQDIVEVDVDFITKTVEDLICILNLPKQEVNIVVLDNDGISKLNRKYLEKEGPTDVLAFSMKDGKDDFIIKDNILGDIAVSAEMAKVRSKELGIDLMKELMLYVVHGVLHLIGYEDYNSSSRKKMKEKEKELLSELGI